MGNRPHGNDRTIQPSALHYSPGFHRFDLPPRVLAEVVFNDGSTQDPQTGTVEFYVTTPEVRTRIKVALVWVPGAGESSAVDSYWFNGALHINKFGDTALWLVKRECGMHGSGSFVHVENLAGDIYVGEPVPDTGDMGYIAEVETTAEQVWGRFFIDAAALKVGTWVLKCATNALEDISESEWKRVCERFAIQVTSAWKLAPNLLGLNQGT